MDTLPKETCQKHSPSSESDHEDDIPLARLKNIAHNDYASCSEDDEPLATLRAQSPQLSEVNSDEFLDDSVADPEYKLGKCEVRRCNDEVWAACEECEILLCYDHFLEEMTCDNHGKSYSKDQQMTKCRKRQGENRRPVIGGEGNGGGREEVAGGGHGGVKERGRPMTSTEADYRDKQDNEGQEREVTHILHTAEEEAGTLRGRKRTRNEEDWKRNIRKRCRTSGKPYVSSKGKEIAGRTMKPSCPDSCKLKCSTKLNENERNSIFRDYWGNADKREQQHYLLRHVEEIPVIRKRVGSEKRSTTMRYHFYRQDTKVKEQVCRTFFLNTLDIRADLVYRTFKRVMDTGGLQQSSQGKHASKNKIDECLLQGVRDHISSFQVVDSHYCRADSVKKYLDPSLSVAGMYRLYQRVCEENGQEQVCEDRYRRIFDYEFNLGFHRPKKDQCEICISYKNKQGRMTEDDQQLFQKHMENKTTARRIKNTAKEDRCPNKTSCSFDLQQILLCPHGQSSSYFYKRKLGVFNFTIYDYKKGDAFCYMWPESEGRRGSNEVATCLYSYMAQQVRENSVKDVSMFSDNCAGQNRNRFVAFALHFVRSEPQMNSITHTFLEKGHTETENDSVHATIERKTGISSSIRLSSGMQL